ncbi:hypothetical protein HG530_003844 [Fusarium avenaceum]|nr:hypothetical protein HG530_003844 [Fusarium avenaceum]
MRPMTEQEATAKGILGTAIKVGIVGGNVDADEEDGGHEQAENTPESPADSLGDSLAGVGSLTGTDTDELGSLVGETSSDEDGPETDELAGGTVNVHVSVCDTGILPVLETNVALVADTSVDADGENDEANDGNNLDHGKPHLNLAENADRDKVKRSEHGPEDADPDGNAEVLVPPTHGKAQGRINEASGIRGEGTGNRDVRSHLAQADHDSVDDRAHKGKGDEQRHGAGLDKSRANTEEETSSNGTANGDELQVTRGHGPVKASLAVLDILLVALVLLLVAHTRRLFVCRG